MYNVRLVIWQQINCIFLYNSLVFFGRSVSHSQRAYGLGIQSFIYRLLGKIVDGALKCISLSVITDNGLMVLNWLLVFRFIIDACSKASFVYNEAEIGTYQCNVWQVGIRLSILIFDNASITPPPLLRFDPYKKKTNSKPPLPLVSWRNTSDSIKMIMLWLTLRSGFVHVLYYRIWPI